MSEESQRSLEAHKDVCRSQGTIEFVESSFRTHPDYRFELTLLRKIRVVYFRMESSHSKIVSPFFFKISICKTGLQLSESF
jgi:hypothetical protein